MKRWIILTLCCALVPMLVACPGLLDWTYELPGECALARVHYHEVVFESKGERVLGNYVFAVSYNDNYIGLQRLPAEERTIDFDAADFSQIEFYLYDIGTETLYGPFVKEEYHEACESLSVGEMSTWENFYKE